MLDRILVGVDGSDYAKCAATVGFGLAAACGASVDVLHVYGTGWGPRGRSTEDDATDRGRAILDATAELASESNLAVETHLVEGRSAKAIVDFAEDRGVDLLVLGRRGRAGLGRRLLGSVTEQVLRRTDRPVLTVPDADAPFEKVLVTTDGSERAEWAVPYAEFVARRCGATLSLLTVVDVQGSAGMFDAGGVSKAFVERLEQQGQDAIDDLGAAVGMDYDADIVRGVPYAEIRDYVEANGVDLVVMASRGHSGFAGQRLGSVTGRVLRVVDVPVLVVTAEP